MYFPSLTRLKDYEVEYELIVRFDLWLSKLSGSQRKGIRPARFASDERIDYNIANELFALAAFKIKLLHANYEVYCPYCTHELVKVFSDIDEIPEKLKCNECGKFFNPYEFDEYIEITFDLLVQPDPDGFPKIKNKLKTNVFGSISSIKSSSKRSSFSVQELLISPLGKEEIEAKLFIPDWQAYNVAYNRFILSLADGVSTEEKGKALEAISCLILSFITFFRVDSTVHTLTNQIDVTVTVRPYFKYIEIPLLRVIKRRLLCECKNEDENVPSIWVDKLAAGIDKVDNCKVGIIFSRHKFSGDDLKHAKASQIEHARLNKYILNFPKTDFDLVHNNQCNILNFLDDKFEELEMRIARRASTVL
ncbi:hypothetical protein [Sporomusa sp. KB1]|jgi:hypothetical protein|uniref:hypothetical protein n=1 Tax=Sporomusa sp. KB1 TaxID=943346 RepID=UPI0011A9B43D|nr:hypothetical protein [Sporomusa sp. KB1]TWH46313.1 hypothetical protein Salpa_2293 [Sporomusa sp. KB1]